MCFSRVLRPGFTADVALRRFASCGSASTNLEDLTGTGRIYRQRQENQVILLEAHK